MRNEIKRRTKRGRSYFDLRRHEGQDALKIQAGLVDDPGGIDAVTTARFIAIKELSQLYYLGSMMDHSIANFLRKHPEAANARTLARLFSYRAPVTSMISKYLDVLGLSKLPPPQNTLEEILAEDSEQDGNDNGGENGRPTEEAAEGEPQDGEEESQGAAEEKPR